MQKTQRKGKREAARLNSEMNIFTSNIYFHTKKTSFMNFRVSLDK
jgi:hypothetical protein